MNDHFQGTVLASSLEPREKLARFVEAFMPSFQSRKNGRSTDAPACLIACVALLPSRRQRPVGGHGKAARGQRRPPTKASGASQLVSLSETRLGKGGEGGRGGTNQKRPHETGREGGRKSLERELCHRREVRRMERATKAVPRSLAFADFPRSRGLASLPPLLASLCSLSLPPPRLPIRHNS